MASRVFAAYDLRLENPGFGNRKPWVFINRQPPLPPPQIARDPPLLVWECQGVCSTMERSAGASFGGEIGGFGGGSGWQFVKARGFLTRGFAISYMKVQNNRHLEVVREIVYAIFVDWPGTSD